MVTTLGRELIRSKLPDKYKQYADRVWDKKTTTALMTTIAKEDPDGYVNILQDLNNIGQAVVSTYGRDAALSFADLKIDKNTEALNAQLRGVINNILNDKSLTNKQKEAKIIDLGYKYTQKVEDAVFQSNNKRNTALASQINSGSRGNKTQLRQLQFGNMLMKDALNRDIPYLMVDPYSRGASAMGYWVSASSGRKGFYDVQSATGQSGYLGKQVTAATHNTIISEDDCGTTDTGVPFPANSDKNVGAVLLRNWKKYPAGTIVTEAMVAEADEGDTMLLRSPMTCKCGTGVCAKCNGLGENGKFPGIGEYVSLNAARSFVEVITQEGVKCLHPRTPVLMGDYTTKALKDIQVGDFVMGASVDGRTAPAKVINVFHNGVMPVYVTSYRCGTDLVSIAATTEHKILKKTDNINSISAIGDKDTIDTALLRTVSGILTTATKTYSKYIGDVDTLDIEVDNKDHLFVLANGLIVSNSKHTGGVGGKRIIDPDGEDQPTGFRNLERMFLAPANFPGGAVLASTDGMITSIKPAAQGGTYITINNQQVYSSPARTLKVKVGDKVYAGDALTNGVPNPMEVMSLKGLGAGRYYFTNKLNDILKSQGWATDRRNIESFTRAMISKVKITDPDGYGSYIPGDIVDYNELMAKYTPRDDAEDVSPDAAINKYLEKPVLYYSIGTKVTPAIAAELKKYKFNNVLVSEKEPPFTPQFLRPAVVLQNDVNWLPRLAGERLRDGLFDAARKGVTDPYDSPSYVDKIIAAPFKP